MALNDDHNLIAIQMLSSLSGFKEVSKLFENKNWIDLGEYLVLDECGNINDAKAVVRKCADINKIMQVSSYSFGGCIVCNTFDLSLEIVIGEHNFGIATKLKGCDILAFKQATECKKEDISVKKSSTFERVCSWFQAKPQTAKLNRKLIAATFYSNNITIIKPDKPDRFNKRKLEENIYALDGAKGDKHERKVADFKFLRTILTYATEIVFRQRQLQYPKQSYHLLLQCLKVNSVSEFLECKPCAEHFPQHSSDKRIFPSITSREPASQNSMDYSTIQSPAPTSLSYSGSIVGYLLVCLPSAHEGGNYSVFHADSDCELESEYGFNNTSARYDSVQWLACREDTKLQMSVITSGYQIMLIYHIVASESVTSVLRNTNSSTTTFFSGSYHNSDDSLNSMESAIVNKGNSASSLSTLKASGQKFVMERGGPHFPSMQFAQDLLCRDLSNLFITTRGIFCVVLNNQHLNGSQLEKEGLGGYDRDLYDMLNKRRVPLTVVFVLCDRFNVKILGTSCQLDHLLGRHGLVNKNGRVMRIVASSDSIDDRELSQDKVTEVISTVNRHEAEFSSGSAQVCVNYNANVVESNLLYEYEKCEVRIVDCTVPVIAPWGLATSAISFGGVDDDGLLSVREVRIALLVGPLKNNY